MGSNVRLGREARDALMKGVMTVADSVRGTLGPKAQTVIFNAPAGQPIVINDGVSIVSQVQMDDPYENLGASLMAQVAQEAQRASGDGTTSATIMAAELASSALDIIDAHGYQPSYMKAEIETALEYALEDLKNLTEPVTDEKLLQVATIAANNDEVIGQVISDAFIMVGADGVVVVEDNGYDPMPSLKALEGMKVSSGSASPHLMKGALERRYTGAMVVVSDQHITDFEEMQPALQIASENKRPLIIFCSEISTPALNTLALNVVQGRIDATVVKVPGHSRDKSGLAMDIAAFSDATGFSEGIGMNIKECSKSDFGWADVIVRDNHTVIIPEVPGAAEGRIEMLKHELTNAENQYEADVLANRISNLDGNVATIRVGGLTAAESLERKARIDDAIHATRAALQGGVCLGGGYTLLKMRGECEPLNHALESIALQLGMNCGVVHEGAYYDRETFIRHFEPEDPEEDEGAPGWGFNAATGVFSWLDKDGVYDPALVIENSLKAAVSIAGLVINTSCLVFKDHQM